MPNSTQPAPAAATPAQRNCCGCGQKFEVTGKDRGYYGKRFCTDACRTGFNARMKAEGAPIIPLVKAWTETRHAKPGTREADICRFARTQITEIARAFNDRDAELGRASAVDYVGMLMDSGIVYADRAGR